jgi:8-oxo-dGTP pyrophosphatase MutT (NUDIX family)
MVQPGKLGHMSNFAENDHIIDPVLQREIIDRILKTHDPDPIVKPAEDLGDYTLPDGRTVRLWLRHAADAILLDDHGQTVLITRLNNPGIGKLAIPGGFIDGDETAEAAARREAVEETGIAPEILGRARTLAVMPRLYDRPGDIRIAWNNLPGTNIRTGDVMMIPTQGVVLKIAGDLRALNLQAGDDAGTVRVAKISALDPAQFGMRDHLPMLQAALKLLDFQ